MKLVTIGNADVPSTVIWPQIRQRYSLERCMRSRKKNVTICFATDRCNDNSKVVLKIVDCSVGCPATNRTSTRREAHILSSVDHPNIVKLVEFYESIDEAILVLDYGGDDLITVINEKGPFTEEDARCVFCQILEALAYLHEHNCAHMDVKLDNIFLSYKGSPPRMRAMLGDFDLAQRHMHSLPLLQHAGTPQYAAPELGQQASAFLPEPADVYSAGVCLYAMLTGSLPPRARDDGPPLRPPDSLSPEARSLLLSMLNPAPHRRPTLRGALASPWCNPSQHEGGAAVEEACALSAVKHLGDEFATAANPTPMRGMSPDQRRLRDILFGMDSRFAGNGRKHYDVRSESPVRRRFVPLYNRASGLRRGGTS
jgi:serine/threonine protein kinase